MKKIIPLFITALLLAGCDDDGVRTARTSYAVDKENRVICYRIGGGQTVSCYRMKPMSIGGSTPNKLKRKGISNEIQAERPRATEEARRA